MRIGVSLNIHGAQTASGQGYTDAMRRAEQVGFDGIWFFDSLGRCSARLEANQPGVLSHTMRTDQRTTMYGAIGGWPWVLFILFAMGATVFGAIFGRPVAKHRIA